MKLHTVNKEKPTEKFMGRERETAKEKSEEHYPITARGLRDPFSAGNLMESSAAMRPSAIAFSISFWAMVERTQLVEDFLAMAFLIARCFTRIQHKVCSGASQERTRQGRLAMEAAEETSW
jgi:hypothetical protein